MHPLSLISAIFWYFHSFDKKRTVFRLTISTVCVNLSDEVSEVGRAISRGRRDNRESGDIERMAAKPGTTSTIYSPVDRTHKTKPSIFADSDWVRPDSRGFHQCQPAFFRTGTVNSASGSAYAEFGNMKVIVSVFGPGESKKAMMYSDIDHGEISSMLHKALEGAIILESFPKTTVDVFALVLESGGSDLPVAISCASLALADTGIMMYDLVVSVSVSCLGKNLLIDLILEEESCQDGSVMIACMPSHYEVSQLTVTGEWSNPNINEVRQSNFIDRSLESIAGSIVIYTFGFYIQAMHLCLDACAKLEKLMRSCLKEAASAIEE